MAEEPKVRGGLCLNVDGEGCKKFTLRDIAREKAKAPIENGPKSDRQPTEPVLGNGHGTHL